MAAEYPKTGSILDSTTRTGLSTQIVIMVNNEPVGAVQSISFDESRQLERLGEVGLDGSLEIVPSGKTSITGRLDRLVYDGLSLPESMSRGFVHIQAQRIPFDIMIIDTYTGTGNDAKITVYKDCWFGSLGVSYEESNYIITQNADFEATTVFTLRGGEAVALSQGIGGARQIPGIQIDDVELQADSGQRRGSLDADGLISAAF